MERSRSTRTLLARYLAVGGFSNGLGYAIYIGMTAIGISPLVSMSFVYIVATGIAFAANRHWTFQSHSEISRSALRAVISQVIGYTTNLILLTSLYYGLGLPHAIAQLLCIAVVAIELFLLNRYYVFN